MFASKIADADAEATETQVWIDFARDCSYISDEKHRDWIARYEELGRRPGTMIANPNKFIPR